MRFKHFLLISCLLLSSLFVLSCSRCGSVSELTDLIQTLLPKIKFTATVDNQTPSVGDIIKYTLCLENEGSATANNVFLDYVAGSGLDFLSVTPDIGTISSGNYEILISELIAGNKLTFCVFAEVLPTGQIIADGTVVFDNAGEGGAAPEPTGNIEIIVSENMDLVMFNAVRSGTIAPDTFDFTFSYRNNGTKPAPYKVILQVNNTGGGSARINPISQGIVNGFGQGEVTGTLPPGGSDSVTAQIRFFGIVGQPLPSGTIVGTIMFQDDANFVDPTPGNDSRTLFLL